MQGNPLLLGEDTHLWWITGFLHDIDFDKHPNTHPAESLRWFDQWGYPKYLAHGVEAHAYGYEWVQYSTPQKAAKRNTAPMQDPPRIRAPSKPSPVPHSHEPNCDSRLPLIIYNLWQAIHWLNYL
jgi:hypothetical protein